MDASTFLNLIYLMVFILFIHRIVTPPLYYICCFAFEITLQSSLHERFALHQCKEVSVIIVVSKNKIQWSRRRLGSGNGNRGVREGEG